MPLMLIDLDNTQLDRAAGFARWAAKYVATGGGTAEDIEWLVASDGDGMAPRAAIAAAVVGRFELGARGEAAIADHLARGMAEDMESDPDIPVALAEARSGGWAVVVGPTARSRSSVPSWR